MNPFRVESGEQNRSNKAHTVSCEGSGCGQTTEHSTLATPLSDGFMVSVPNERPARPNWPMCQLHGPLAQQSGRGKSCCPQRGCLFVDAGDRTSLPHSFDHRQGLPCYRLDGAQASHLSIKLCALSTLCCVGFAAPNEAWHAKLKQGLPQDNVFVCHGSPFFHKVTWMPVGPGMPMVRSSPPS